MYLKYLFCRERYGEIFPKISLSFLINILGALLAFGQQVLLTNLMEPAQYGIYVYASTWLLILSFIPRLGLDTCLLTYLAEYRANNQWALFFGLLKRSDDFVKVLGYPLMLLVMCSVFFFRHRLGVDLFTTFFIGSAVIPFTAFSRLYQATLQSVDKALYSLIFNLILFPISISFLIIFLSYKGLSIQSIVVMFTYLFALTMVNISMWIASRRALRKHYPDVQQQRQYQTKVWLAAALPLFCISFLQLLLTRVDVVMIGWLLGPEQSGLYAVSSLAASTVLFGIAAAHTVVAPQISYFYHRNDMHRLQDILNKEMLLVLTMTLPIMIALLVLGKPILSLFGKGFSQAYGTLAILLLGQTVTALMGSISFMMIVGGYQNMTALMMFFCVLINILCNYIFIPLYGITGAAWSNTVTMMIWHLGMYVFVRKHFLVDTTIFSLIRQRYGS